MDSKTLNPVINTNVKMGKKMMDALNRYEAICAVTKVKSVSANEVRAFLADSYDDAFASRFEDAFLYPASVPETL